MDPTTQVKLAKQLFSFLDNGSTAMADAVYLNAVENYTSEARLEREQAVLFQGYPLLAGLSCEISEPGDYLTDDRSSVPILVEGRGRCKRFSCPCHAWTYAATGDLVGIPEAKSFAGVDKKKSGLVQLPLVEK